MWSKIFIYLTFFTLTNQQQYDASKFDRDLFQIFTDLVNKEDDLSEMMLKIVPSINSTVIDLSIFPRFTDLVTALRNLAECLIRQSSLDNYPPYQNISTCSDVNMKITTLQFDIKQYYSLYVKAAANLTELYRFNVFVAHHYALNLHHLTVGSTNQRNIDAIIRNVNLVVVEYQR